MSAKYYFHIYSEYLCAPGRIYDIQLNRQIIKDSRSLFFKNVQFRPTLGSNVQNIFSTIISRKYLQLVTRRMF